LVSNGAAFPLIKLAKKLKDNNSSRRCNCSHWFPLIKLAKKLKVFKFELEELAKLVGEFPLIKLAKKLKDRG